MDCAGIDGESISPWGYCLLSSSSSDRLSERRRLTSRECFEFLLRQAGDGVRLFGYGLGYDVCHWVADLSGEEKTRLATKGMVYTQQGATVYRVTYRPNAYFTVQRLRGLAKSEVTGTATVVDLMKWHRKPFVDACEEWLDFSWTFSRVRGFKENRQGFKSEALPAIMDYCSVECEMLRELAEGMAFRLRDLGIPVSHPFTAGAVAGALMARHKVQDLWREPPSQVSDAVSRAFFGGREQCSRYGHFQDVTQWDIRSAYGWAMTQLPDMLGRWIHDPSGTSNGLEIWSLCKVQWDIDEGRHPVMPFPWRDGNGRVHYPPRGTGWQWSPIVRSALRNYPGGSIKILDAWHYVPASANRPFGYIGELFHKRRQAGDDPVSRLLKSIIVATWGRTCSQGFKRDCKTRGMLDWAGITTALIQERMLDAIHATGENEFVSACVDGFWTTSRKPLVQGGSLGEWSQSLADELLLLRPACYWKREEGEWSGHTSGIPGGTRLAEDALLEWRNNGWRRGEIRLAQQRCKGLLACSVDGDYSQLGQFIDLPLSLTFNPGMGRMGHECPTAPPGDGWRNWKPYWPPVAIAENESAPFVSRTGIVDDRWKERREANAIEEASE